MERQLEDIHPRLVLSPSKRARKVALRLDTRERVIKLVLPRRFSKRKALAFARSHKRWIHDKFSELPAPVYYEDGGTIPVFGTGREIVFCSENNWEHLSVVVLDEEFVRVKADRGEPARRLERFLKKEVKKELTRLAHEKVARIGATVNKVSVRDTKSRWGSCSDKGNLSFSWRLIFAPYETLDYLVAHEVAHLKHLDHSRDFWAVCRDLSADYKVGKRWIKANGPELMRYMAKPLDDSLLQNTG